MLKPGGDYIVYPRFRKHNAHSIWGRLFPHFTEKETRLYNPVDFKGLEGECSELVLDSLDELSFEIQFSRAPAGVERGRLRSGNRPHCLSTPMKGARAKPQIFSESLS